jgi:formate dehydrogenase
MVSASIIWRDEQRIRTGVGPNEFTASEDRDPWVGTPWHKSIPARLEAIPTGL